MDPSQDVLEQVAQAARLREGPAGVAAFLREVFRHSPLPTGELARRLGWPTPVAAAVRGELERAGLLVRTRGGSALGEQGQAFAREVLGLAAREDPLCPTCAGRRVVIDPARYGALLARLEQIHRANPTVDTTLDQSHGTPETALRRALAMVREGALEGKDVLILGDDDLVSVAVGLLSLSISLSISINRRDRDRDGEGLVRRLVVVDVDERFLAHVAAAGQELGFSVETVAHDLREPLPGGLRAAFDTVETDPPYTVAGLRLFLSRGLEGLRPGGGRDAFLSYAPRDPEGQREVVRTCVELGLAPVSITPDFNRYAGAGTLAGSGQFLHLRTTAEARPAVAGRYEGPLYTMEERLAWRTYRCTGCGALYQVGPGEEFATIEALKARGCPRCGGRRFRAGRRTSAR
jgi:predicted methyltransferase/DNA-directed RNA polymerase subunit RPC12/RpoP